MKGRLTEEVQVIAKKYLGRVITKEELRLMPYLQYVLMDSGKIEWVRIKGDENEILKSWSSNSWIHKDTNNYVTISKHFWDCICEILFESYVPKKEEV